MRLHPLAVLLCSLAAALQDPPPAARAAAPPPASKPRDDTAIRIDQSGFVLRAGAIDPQELVEATAKFLGRNILWAASERGQGRGEPFDLQKDLALDARGCEEVVSKLLYSRGFVIMPLHADKGLFEVVSMNGSRAREVMGAAIARTPEEILRQPDLKMVVYTQLELQHIDANYAANSLRPFFAQTAANQPTMVIGTAGSTSTLLLSGFQDQVAQALRLVRVCDRPETRPQQVQIEQRLAAIEQQLQALQALRPARPAATDGK